MKKLLLFVSVFIGLSSCSKYEINPSTGVPKNKGRLKCVNSSNDPYQIKIDGGSQGQLNGGYYQNFDLTPGSHHVYVKQLSGYVLYPTERQADVYISSGNETVFTFP